MTAQHKPPYLRRLRFAADQTLVSSPLDPSCLILIVGHSMHLLEEAFPWAGRVAASSLSFSRFRYRIVSLGDQEAPPLTQGGLPPLRLMRTRFPRREKSNEREAPFVACIALTSRDLATHSRRRSLVLDVSLGCAESNLLRFFFPLQKRDPLPPL